MSAETSRWRNHAWFFGREPREICLGHPVRGAISDAGSRAEYAGRKNFTVGQIARKQWAI